MKGKGWLAAVIMAAVLTFSIACAETALTLPEAGLRLKTPEDWQAITAETADQYADALAALGTSPEVVRADLQASGALALWYAPDLEVRLVNLGQAAVDSVWTAGEEEKAALLAQLQAAYSGTEAQWADASWLTLQGEESLGSLTVYRSVWATCQYGQLYAIEAVRYGQAFTDAQQAEIAALARNTLVLGRQAEVAGAQKVVYPDLEIPTWAG